MTRLEKDILHGNIYVQIFLFFVPVFLGYLFQQLYNTVDAMIVGKFVGKEALAAVGGSTSTMINLIINFIIGLSSGVTVIIAQYYGRNDRDAVKEAVKTGYFLAIVMGAIMMVVGIVLTPWLLSIMNVTTEIMEPSTIYMRVYFCGLVPNLIYNVGSSILRATGDSKRPLYFLMIACLVNIVLDVVLVLIFKLGVYGVGIATVISQVVSSILILHTFKTTSDCYQFGLRDFGVNFPLLKRTLLIGLPSGIQNVLYSVSNLSIQARVNSFGTDTIAAYTAFGKIDAMYWNFDSAFGIAVMTIAGQNYGARQIDRVKETTRKGLLMQLIGSLIISGSIYLFARPLVVLFTNDPSVIQIGIEMTRFLSLFWPIFIIIEVISSVTKACGDVFVPMIIAAIGICVVRISWISLYNCKNVIEALYCYPISWVITGIAFIIYYLRGKWLKVR